MCHISSARVVRSPIFGFAGWRRSRGRRHPYFRTRWYQVDGDAQTLPSRCARTASVPVVLGRGDHVLDYPDFRWRQPMRRRARTGRLVVKRTRVLPSPGMEPTRRQAEEPEKRPQRDARAGPIDGPQDPHFGAAVGQPLARQGEPRGPQQGQHDP